MINYREVWVKGGYNKDNKDYFDNSIMAVKKRAEQNGLPEDAAADVIHQVMLEVADGRQYPLDKCPCGCGIDKSGTAITHEMFSRLDKMIEGIKKLESDSFEKRLMGMREEYDKQDTIFKKLGRKLKGKRK